MKVAKQLYRQRQQRYQQKQKKSFLHYGKSVVYEPSSTLCSVVRVDLMEGMLNIFCKHLVKGMSRDT